MGKIIVPQELQEQIIDLYVNKQYTRKAIKQELSLPFGDSVIKRILEENNIQIRTNNGAQAGGRKKTKVEREVQDQIIELYNKGYGLNKIVRELHLPFGFDKVKSILKDNNIKIRNVQESAQVKNMPDLRKYKINDDYNFESHNGAWILGFIAADGYLPITNGAQNRITISLQRRDEEVLQMIAKELEYEGPIYQYEQWDGHLASSLSFTSKKIRQTIESYGIGNNKTFKLHNLPDNLPREFLTDYIRGFFDGDGSIYEPKGKKVNMSFTCVSDTFLQDIALYLNETYGVKIPRIRSVERVHIIYDIRYYVADSLKLGKVFYDNNYLALPRKKQHYFDILDKYSLR